MKSFRNLIGVLLIMGTSVAVGYGLSRVSPQTGSSGGPSADSAATLPKDIFPETRNRLPAINREDLDEAGKKLYDAARGGAFGPDRLRLYSPQLAAAMSVTNDYLRNKSGLELRLAEVATLVTAREMDCQYVWTAHEAIAMKAGIQQETIDIIKYRKPLKGLGEEETSIIQMGREVMGKHMVSSDTAARALKLFGNQKLVDILSVMGYYASNAILLNTFDQHVRPADKALLPIP
jgi:4-carboxymuconolactone decarboxylase